jgi:hypothetical protein
VILPRAPPAVMGIVLGFVLGKAQQHSSLLYGSRKKTKPGPAKLADAPDLGSGFFKGGLITRETFFEMAPDGLFIMDWN